MTLLAILEYCQVLSSINTVSYVAQNLTYTDTKLSGTGLAAAHKVSALAIKALYIIELPGPYDSLTFSFRNAFAIIVPGKWTVAFDSTFSSSNVDSLRCGEDRLRRRGEYLPWYGPLSPTPSGISTTTNEDLHGEPCGNTLAFKNPPSPHTISQILSLVGRDVEWNYRVHMLVVYKVRMSMCFMTVVMNKYHRCHC